MDNHLGAIIKQLRIALGMTQQELAAHICTQAEISRIESGKVIPYANVLHQISTKLGVDMQYFFTKAEVPNYEYIQNTFETIRRLVKQNQYQEVWEIVEFELGNPTFAQMEHHQFLLWHKGMAHFYLEREAEQAIGWLEAALRLGTRTVPTEMEIEILNTLGNVYSDNGQFERAEQTFRRCLDAFQQRPYRHNPQIEIRLYYNFSLSLSKAGQDVRSIPLCRQGIKRCKQLESLYLLGELYYQLGYSLGQVNKLAEAYRSLEHALHLFKMLEKEEYAAHAAKQLQTLQERMQENRMAK